VFPLARCVVRIGLELSDTSKVPSRLLKAAAAKVVSEYRALLHVIRCNTLHSLDVARVTFRVIHPCLSIRENLRNVPMTKSPSSSLASCDISRNTNSRTQHPPRSAARDARELKFFEFFDTQPRDVSAESPIWRRSVRYSCGNCKHLPRP